MAKGMNSKKDEKRRSGNTGAGQKTAEFKDDFSVTCSDILSGVVTVGITVLLTVFPLIYGNAYFDILEVKYKCYYLCVLVMLAVVLLLAAIMAVIDVMEFKGEHARNLFARLKPGSWKDTFRIADAAVIIFWLTALISTLQSDYVFEAFWGNEGRFTGLFLLTLYVCTYFMVSRLWKKNNWCMELFLLSGMVMCVIGITDYFQMDVLRFRVNIKPEQSTLFTSTIGNINTYTAYVGLIMGFAAGMFAVEQKLWKTVWYYICMTISFFAIIMGCSDNAYLGIAALFGLIPFVMFQSRQGVKRYLIMLATFFSVVQCIDIINQAYAEVVIGLDSLFLVMVNFKGLLYVVLLLWALVAAFCVYERRNVKNAAGQPVYQNGDGTKSKIWGRNLVRAWGIFAAVVILGICFAVYDANSGNAQRYGSLGSYLVFSDSWGTNRGYIWRKAIELYRDFPIIHKLFGYGPDTFGILTTTRIRPEMVAATGQIFDSVHNEYLQYLVTIGPIGTAAYLVFLVSALWSMMKKRTECPGAVALVSALVCYAFQALVNINLPMATPVMWLMLSVGMAVSREGQ